MTQYRITVTQERSTIIELKDGFEERNFVSLERELENGEVRISEVATLIGASAPEIDIEGTTVDLEQRCEKHEDVWFGIDTFTRKKLARCWKCLAEERREQPEGGTK